MRRPTSVEHGDAALALCPDTGQLTGLSMALSCWNVETHWPRLPRRPGCSCPRSSSEHLAYLMLHMLLVDTRDGRHRKHLGRQPLRLSAAIYPTTNTIMTPTSARTLHNRHMTIRSKRPPGNAAIISAGKPDHKNSRNNSKPRKSKTAAVNFSMGNNDSRATGRWHCECTNERSSSDTRGLLERLIAYSCAREWTV